jgi:HK97 family phage portal protein
MWPFRTKENPLNSTIVAISGGSKVVYTPKNYEALAKAGYQNCSVAYACTKLIASTASRLEWYLMREGANGKNVELERHPLLDLLKRPNEVESGSLFTEKLLSHLLLAGNAYALGVSGSPNQPPQFLYSMRPDRVVVNADRSGRFLVESYTYSPGQSSQTFLPEQVMHMMEFHPTHDFYGLSRIEVAAQLVDQMNASAEWNAKRLQNDMRPPGMLTAKSKWNVEQLRSQFREQYQGSENAGKPLVFSGEDIEWTDMSISAKDADWLEGQKFSMRQICSIYGIDPCLVGDPEYATYSNKREARKGLYLEVILPLMDMLRDEYQRWLVPRYGQGLILEYDRDQIEELKEDRVAQSQYLATAWWMTPNEKRVAMGLEELGPDGDSMMVPMGLMPIADAVAPPGDLTSLPDDESDPDAAKMRRKSLGGFWRGETERKALWQNFERRVAAKERAFGREVESWLKSQAKAAADKVVAGATTAGQAFDEREAAKSYVDKFTPRYRKLYATARAAGQRMTEGKLYDFNDDEKADGGWIDPATRAKLERLIEESAKVITDETLTEIQAVMRDSLDTNLTVQEIANAISDKVGDAMAPMRARRIARTETGMLENQGNLDGFKDNEFVNRKGWLCSFVEASRDAHMDADGQEVGVDDSFTVGGERMDYPLDRSHGASAGNVVNCLCAIYPIVE